MADASRSAQIRIPEIRNPKEIRNPNSESTADRAGQQTAVPGPFRVSGFGLPSDFGFRISDLTPSRHPPGQPLQPVRRSRLCLRERWSVPSARVPGQSTRRMPRPTPTMPAKPMHGMLNSAAALRDLPHALAHQRRAVDRSLARDHQVRRAQTSLQRGLPRNQIEPRAASPPPEMPSNQSPARLRRRRPVHAQSHAPTPAGRPAPFDPGSARPGRNPAGATLSAARKRESPPARQAGDSARRLPPPGS